MLLGTSTSLRETRSRRLTLFGRRRHGGKHGAGKRADSPVEAAAGNAAREAKNEQAPGVNGHALGTNRLLGPWDETESAPAYTRVDLGAIRMPVQDGVEMQLNLLEDEVVAVTAAYGESTLQVQAFAAPKSDGLWEEARQEIAVELQQGGSTVNAADGPFGTELRGHVTLPSSQPDQHQAGQAPVLQGARFVGVDGPRWLLRGVFTGAAADPAQQHFLEEVFRGIVVVRGTEPMPPRERLPLRVPDGAEQPTRAGESAPEGQPQ